MEPLPDPGSWRGIRGEACRRGCEKNGKKRKEKITSCRPFRRPSSLRPLPVLLPCRPWPVPHPLPVLRPLPALLPCRPWQVLRPLRVRLRAAASSVTTGAATTFSPTSFGAATILPLTLMVDTFRCEGVGSLWPECRSASLIFSRYWGVE